MTSEKQAKANRKNALESTGPKTPEGKAAVRLNAVRHGLLSKDVLLPGENENALKELDGRLRAELQPAGELEDLLVEQITAAVWRLRRLRRVETGVFAWQLYEELAARARRKARAQEKTGLDQLREETSLPSVILDQRKHEQALSEAEEMEAARDSETATLGRTFIRDADDANAFSKLSRYETTLERGLYKALHELQRLQAARRADGSAPPPVAIDVEVSGVSRDEP